MPATAITPTKKWDGIYLTQAPISGGGTRWTVNLGQKFEQFDSIGTLPSGSSLSGSGGSFDYRSADGTVVSFIDPAGTSASNPNFCNGSGQPSCKLLPGSIASPDGKLVELQWDVWTYCWGEITPEEVPCSYDARLSRISNSSGYAIQFAYTSGGDGGVPVPDSWFIRTGASFYNDVVGSSPQGSVSYELVSTGLNGVYEVTDMAGRLWRFSGSSAQVRGIRRPGALADTKTISFGTGYVTSVTNEGVTTNYSRSVSGSTATMTVTNALSQASTIVSDLTIGRPTSITDALSRATSFQYDTSGRLTRATTDEGNYVSYIYDARGNVTQTDFVPKSGSGESTLTISASYDSTCANPVTCNQPNSTTDARGKVTEYTYYSTHGGLETVTYPAPATSAVRPQTRYTYTLANGVYRVTGVSQCQTGSSCTGGVEDEVKSTIAYDANGNVTSQSTGNGSGTLTATTAMTYDALGNLLTTDGPLSGTADTTRIRYNAARQVVGAVSPDPDGGGSLKHRAVRTTYTNGLPTKTERGTVDSQSDSDWSAFSAVEAVETGFDDNARPTTQRLVSGSTTYALTQASYDALGRVECVAQRMNPAEFAPPLPSTACTLDSQGSYGPDRIVKTFRDAAGQVTQVKTGFGVTGQEANEVTTTYTDNGKTESVTDAEGNKTTYEYDGHDRLRNIRFPSPTTDGVSAPTSGGGADFEQLTYDAGSNVTNRLLRGGTNIGFTYDDLGRVIAKDLPGSEPDVTYTYDALSRMTGASQTGNALSFTYDALSRNLTQVGPHGTVTSTYDIAGRRTQIIYPGGDFGIDQDYLVTGEVSAIREDDVTSGPGILATYAYDDLGRRSSLTRGNGSVLTYSYDNVSRLSQIADNLSGTSHDQTLGFTYNPAGGIVANSRTNDLYGWAEHFNVNRNYTTNGLNQYSAITSVSPAPSYDARGNLTSAGSTTFGYSSENLLTSATGGITLSYDPALRLYQTAGSVTTRLAYDGVDLIAEYNGSNVLLRRYVHGPGSDEPIAWYEISGTTERRFLHADERGSITAITDSSGGVVAVNAYDEYGIPGSANVGRFQYTGQTWLSDLGMYYYKARIYSPTLGRFLQTDPIGYSDGMNLYAYVGGDPVNFTDPFGLKKKCKDAPAGNIMVCGNRGGGVGGGASGGSGGVGGGGGDIGEGEGEVCVAGTSCDFAITAPKDCGFLGFECFVKKVFGGGAKKSTSCSGTYVTTTYGASGTAAMTWGRHASGGVIFTRPLVNDSWNPLKGVQIGFTGQFSRTEGFGMFIGGGEQVSLGLNNGPVKGGSNTSEILQVDFGLDAAWGGSFQETDSSLIGEVSGRFGGGAGFYGGRGQSRSYTLITKPFGC